MCQRVEGSAKFIAIWWCLLAFIASGYEHSIANMTIFALSWFGVHKEELSLAGIGHNLLWVTIGNTISGVVFMGLGYWFTTPKSQRPIIQTDINRHSTATTNSVIIPIIMTQPWSKCMPQQDALYTLSTSKNIGKVIL